jgi:hypothetical protein
VIKVYHGKQCCGSRSGILDLVLFDPWIKDPDPNPDPRSGMSILDHISESLETFFWVKNTEIL